MFFSRAPKVDANKLLWFIDHLLVAYCWAMFHTEPAHLVAHQRTQHSIVVRLTTVRAISTDIICQTIVQHCRTS